MAIRRLTFINISLYLSTGLFFLILYVIFFSRTPNLSLPINKQLDLHEKIAGTIKKDISQLEKEVNQLLFNKSFQKQFSIKEKRKTITKLFMLSNSFADSLFPTSRLTIPLKKISYKKSMKQGKVRTHRTTTQYLLSRKDLQLNVPYVKNGDYFGEITFFFDASLWLNGIIESQAIRYFFTSPRILSNDWFNNQNLLGQYFSSKKAIEKKILISPSGNILLIEEKNVPTADFLKKLEQQIINNYGHSGQYHINGKKQNVCFTFSSDINTHLISLYSSSKSGLTLPAIILLSYSILQIIILLIILLYQQTRKKATKTETTVLLEEIDIEAKEDIHDSISPNIKHASSAVKSKESSAFLEEVPTKLYESNKSGTTDEIDELLADLNETDDKSDKNIESQIPIERVKKKNDWLLSFGLDLKKAMLGKEEDNLFETGLDSYFPNFRILFR